MRDDDARGEHNFNAASWLALAAASSALFSLMFACAAPFAAVAAFAAAKVSLRLALGLVSAAFVANQAVGFLFLSYPLTLDSCGWGAAIGLTAVIATLAAAAIPGSSRSRPHPLLKIIASFAGAFVVVQAGLFAASFILPPGDEAFAPNTVIRLFFINALTFAGLFGAGRLLATPATSRYAARSAEP